MNLLNEVVYDICEIMKQKKFGIFVRVKTFTFSARWIKLLILLIYQR